MIAIDGYLPVIRGWTPPVDTLEGLPVLLVVGIGGMLLVMLGVFLSLGILAIKIVLPIVLIVWFVKWLRRRWAREPGLDADVAPGTP